MIPIDTRVEVVLHDDWDNSLYRGLQGTVVEQPNGALPYETDWPWVALDSLPTTMPRRHDKIMMFNPLALKVIDE